MKNNYYGAVEAGGTKFRCGIGTGSGEWLRTLDNLLSD